MQGFHILATSENTSKYDEISDSKEETFRGVPLQQILDAASQRLLQKKLECGFVLQVGKFFQNKHKKQLLVNNSENIK